MSRYIDADRLKEELKNSGYCYNNWLDIEMYINNQPTADVRENVKGEWIEKYYASNETGETVFHGMIMCSVCGHVPKVGWLSNFCPDCGADMRGEA